jgi:nitrate reductase molybdenum cofactor assembly chaperone NarJ/NarW
MYEHLASLVSYPDAGLFRALDGCIRALAPELPEAATLLAHFRDAAGELGQDALEEAYIQVFEMQAVTALYIGHQLFGEDWRRGTFMACLKGRYQECGFTCGAELPDHASVILRFLSVEQRGPEKDELIGDCIVPALYKVLRAIEVKKTPYGNVLRALLLYLGAGCDGGTETEDISCRPSSLSLFPILP